LFQARQKFGLMSGNWSIGAAGKSANSQEAKIQEADLLAYD
jgi:hypothetical protein